MSTVEPQQEPAAESFINRELAWLSFNEQVLAEALDPETPLLERLRFISIVANNLDEFFMVRVAELKRRMAGRSSTRCPAGMTPVEQLAAVSERCHRLVAETYRCANGDVFPLLADHGISIRKWAELTPFEQGYLSESFRREVFPVLTPIVVDEARPLPALRNLRIYVGALLQNAKKPKERRFAVVQVPSSLARFIRLPGVKKHHLVLLEDVIQACLGELFPGREVVHSFVFRVTRDSELDFDGDAQTFLSLVERELQKRRTNRPVRLEINAGAGPELLALLREKLELFKSDVYVIDGPLDLSSFFVLADMEGYDGLRYKPLPPMLIPEFQDADDPFEVIRRGDILLHHPYDSFDPVIELLQAAAADPDVLAIKQTLYRTSRDSAIIEALTLAAENGKQVCVLVELMARFDEESNVERAKALENAGAHVIWGIVDYKVHSKICLVVRKEPDGLRRYVHLGTGNYNERTVRVYEDIGLMTADEEFGEDASNFFNSLTGYSDVPTFNHFVMAPYGLRERLLTMINREKRFALAGGPAAITAKMNSLVDPQLIDALYDASRAGVIIRLNVRGICCLRPGVPGLSDNIKVVSVIGRFLEHARIFHFHNAGNDEIYLSSADWMPRNLDRRIELMFPVKDREIQKQLLDILEVYFKDNKSSRVLLPDGTYERKKPRGGEPVIRAHYALYDATAEINRRKAARLPMQFVPKERPRPG